MPTTKSLLRPQLCPSWMFLGFLLVVSFPPGLWSYAGEKEPTGEEILQRARLHQTAQVAHLQAQLRTGRSTIPFTITLAGEEIRYTLVEPEETIILRLGERSAELLVRQGARNEAPMRFVERGERVRGSSLTYEDLALRFLYWPGVKLLGAEHYRSRPAWRLELHPHDKRSHYGAVRLLVDQDTGALLRVEGFDWEGRLMKRFEVVAVQRIEGQYFLRSMRVESFDPATRKVLDRTYLEVTAVGQAAAG